MAKTQIVLAAHPIQEKLLNLVATTDAGMSLTLRDMAEKIGEKRSNPQQIKHHLTQLIRYGFLNIVDGRYTLGQRYKDLLTRTNGKQTQ